MHKEAPWNSTANFISLPLWAFKMHVSILKILRSLEIWHVINFIYFGFPEFIWIPQLLVHLPWPSLHPQIPIKWDSECLLYTLPVLLVLVWLFYIWSWRTDHESSDSVVSKDGVAALLSITFQEEWELSTQKSFGHDNSWVPFVFIFYF